MEQFHTHSAHLTTHKHERRTEIPREVQVTGHSLNEHGVTPSRDKISLFNWLCDPLAPSTNIRRSLSPRKNRTERKAIHAISCRVINALRFPSLTPDCLNGWRLKT